MAERLVAENNSEENRLLLAKCYMEENQIHKAHYILQGCKNGDNRYQLALACIKLNKYEDAERALREPYAFTQKFDTQSLESVPNGAAGLYLLGNICEKLKRTKEALRYYQRCLEKAPHYWCAFERLCKMGTDVQPQSYFNDTSDCINARMAQASTLNESALSAGSSSRDRMASSSGFDALKGSDFGSKHSGEPNIRPFSIDSHFTPPEFKSRDRNNIPDSAEMSPDELGKLNESVAVISNFTNNEPINDLKTLLGVLGRGYAEMTRYRCSESAQVFKSLPDNQYYTGWVLLCVGRCYFENGKYPDAEKVYNESLRIEPYRLEGLEYYSTCLWHLKKQVELTFLANSTLEKNLFAPEAWCVVGNCYSLQKEHETALKYFQRAIQLNPAFGYAYTLCGHEYVQNEDFEKAKDCFQRAIATDCLHYNAWWGIGNIHYKQERYEDAISFFRKAIEINPRSSILYTYLGMALHNNNKLDDALTAFSKAERIDPSNPLVKFQKANVLMSRKNYDDALKELQTLLKIVPKEAPIHIQIGKIYKHQGDKVKAHQHLSNALALDNTRDNHMVKSLIDQLHNENDFNEDHSL